MSACDPSSADLFHSLASYSYMGVTMIDHGLDKAKAAGESEFARRCKGCKAAGPRERAAHAHADAKVERDAAETYR